jgi:hypothetical protein
LSILEKIIYRYLELENYLKHKNNSFIYFSLTSSSENFVPQRPATSFSRNRLYPTSGMIPKYTGYLPRMNISIYLFITFFFLERKYHIGQTYGDTSRDLPVCSHSFNNYGDFVRSKTAMAIRTNDVN